MNERIADAATGGFLGLFAWAHLADVNQALQFLVGCCTLLVLLLRIRSLLGGSNEREEP